jgi:hypothetical protein
LGQLFSARGISRDEVLEDAAWIELAMQLVEMSIPVCLPCGGLAMLLEFSQSTEFPSWWDQNFSLVTTNPNVLSEIRLQGFYNAKVSFNWKGAEGLFQVNKSKREMAGATINRGPESFSSSSWSLVGCGFP